MVRDVIVVGSCAAAIYGWLCAVLPPAVRAMRTVAVRRTSAALRALALAMAGAVVWTFIAATALFLLTMLEPRAGLALLDGSAWLPGVVAGTACWMCQAAASRRVPRIGPDFEVATALAIVALVRDEPATLARVERLYRSNAVPDDPARSRYLALAAGN